MVDQVEVKGNLLSTTCTWENDWTAVPSIVMQLSRKCATEVIMVALGNAKREAGTSGMGPECAGSRDLTLAYTRSHDHHSPLIYRLDHIFTLLLSSFWTSRGHRCRPFSPPVLAFKFYRA